MARSERSDRDPRGSSSARGGGNSSSSRAGRSGSRSVGGDSRSTQGARDRTAATNRNVPGRSSGNADAPTTTIPTYSPSFPEPDFDLANRASASAAAGTGAAGTGATAAGTSEGTDAAAATTATTGAVRPPTDEFVRAADRESRQRPADAGARRNRPRRPRRAQLQLRHINPWTVLRFSCVLAIALFFVWLIIVGVLYGVLDAAGVVDKINNAVTTINGDGSSAPIRAAVVFGGAAIIGVVNMILFIALSTIGSVVYNLCADLVGGIEITLSEA